MNLLWRQLAWLLWLVLAFGAAAETPLLERASEAAASMDYQAARRWLEQAIEQAQASGDRPAQARALLEMATILRHSGAADRALEPVAEAVALLEQEPPSPLLADALSRRAEARQARGDGGGAERDLEAASALFRAWHDQVGAARVEATASVLASRRGEYRLALDRGRRALEHADGPSALRALSAVAYSQHQLGRWPAARASYDQLIEDSWRLNDQRMLSFAYCNRAEVSWRLGEEKPAVEDLWRAVERFEAGRGRTAGSADERAAFLEREVAAYDRLVRYLVDQGEIEAAFGVAERLHGRSLLDRLSGAIEESGVEAGRAIVEQIGRLRLELAETASANRAELTARLLALGRSLRELDSKRGPRPSAGAAQLSTVQSALAHDEALLSFWSAEERTMVWTVTRDRVQLIQVPVPQRRLYEVLDRFTAPLRSASRAADQALLGAEIEHLEAGRRLHDWLVAPLGKLASDASRWLIVPDGRLHELPFEALVESCHDVAGDAASVHALYATCRYLGQGRSIAYSPSAGVLLALRQRRASRVNEPPRSLLALAPSFEGEPGTEALLRANRGPLRHSADEVRRIGRFFDDARLLLGPRAHEGVLKGQLAAYRRLHFATHGLVDDELPLGAGLLLEKTRGEDGLLLIPEVLDFELAADLVTLSACRTGRGRASRAEGLMGLSRAFLAAGASALVVSLWDVDDRSTALLMDAFYRRLAAGERPSDALRGARAWLITQQGETRLVFKKQPVSYAHPRYWAGFIVVGAD